MAKKRKGLPPPSNLILSSSRVPIMETEGIRDGPLTSAGKASVALEGRNEESTTTTKTRAKVGKAQASVVESLMWITRLATKAKATMAKVKWVKVPMVGIVEGGEARPPITQEAAPIPSNIHLLGVDRCPRFLNDSIPLEVKEEALKSHVGEGL